MQTNSVQQLIHGQRNYFTFIGAWHLIVRCVSNSSETEAVHPPTGGEQQKREDSRGVDGLYGENGRC